jgi:histidinol-phosphatase (PHP family)
LTNKYRIKYYTIVNWEGGINLINANFHTHTYRCKHAQGEVVDYAKAAVEAGLDILGISDHTPLPGNRWLEMRMRMDELEGYIRAICEAKESFPKLNILTGMECEYLKENHNFYTDELLGTHEFDYLSASAHYFPFRGDWKSGWDIRTKGELVAYSEYIVQMMETGLFDYVAHPDIFGGNYHIWDDNTAASSKYIFEAAEALNIPLEINAYGFRKGTILTGMEERHMYPWEPFWALASQYNLSVTVNSDAHRPQDIIGKMEDALLLVDKYGLKLVDSSFFCNKRKLKQRQVI